MWRGNNVPKQFRLGQFNRKNSAFRSIQYGSAYNLPTTVTKSGYTFLGWYTAETGGSKVESSGTMLTASNHTLYAHWELKTVTVTVTGTSTPAGTGYSFMAETTLNGETFQFTIGGAYGAWNASMKIGSNYSSTLDYGGGTIPTNCGPLTYTAGGYTVTATKAGDQVTFVIQAAQ